MPAPELNPDEALKKVLELSQRLTSPRADPSPEEGVRLAELVQVLDRWLSGGGRLPSAWTQINPPTP